MPDSTLLLIAVDRLADRFRALPGSRLRRVADAGLALARDLSVTAQRLEDPQRAPLLMPDEGIYPVGDQIAVAGHDLALALEGRSDGDELSGEALRKVAEIDRLL
jgi:hypothetical protein